MEKVVVTRMKIAELRSAGSRGRLSPQKPSCCPHINLHAAGFCLNRIELGTVSQPIGDWFHCFAFWARGLTLADDSEEVFAH
jgi:hypothetical protein